MPHGPRSRRAGVLDAADARTLAETARLAWRVQAALRLLANRTTDPAGLGAGARAFLLRETGAADLDALCTALAQSTVRAAAIIDRTLPAPHPEGD